MTALLIYLPHAERFHAWLPICGRVTKRKSRCLARVSEAGTACFHHQGHPEVIR